MVFRLVLLWGYCLAATAAVPITPIAVDANTSSEDCLECHGYQGFAVPTGEVGESKKRQLHVESSAFKKSVHRKVKCASCHIDIEQMPHRADIKRQVDCISCHKSLSNKNRTAAQTEIHATKILTHSMVGLPSSVPLAQKTKLDTNAEHYLSSIHAAPSKKDPSKAAASCWDCHGAHKILPLAGNSGNNFRINSPQICGSCHDKQLQEYKQSVHGAPVQRYGKLEPAVCSDCHTAHKISTVKKDPAKLLISSQCGNCHEKHYQSYSETYHGQIVNLGYTHTAKCHDCHAPHATRRQDDPLSLVHKNNLLKTCSKCHKDASAGYLTFYPHGTTHDYDKFPEMWLVSKFMIGLLLVVFIFFWGHSVLWYLREKQEFADGANPNIRLDKNGKPLLQGQYITRFSKGWMLAHLVLAVAVMTLVITGTTVLFANSFWAPLVMKLLGGAESAAILHRLAAVTFAAIFFGHLFVIFRKIYLDNKLHGIKFDWFGPHSLLPRLQDGRDMVAMFKWFLGKGDRPVFDRWTYWEKFDYWAPFWGMFVIGCSGLLLWFPSFFGSFMPGWVFNVATIIHGEEAFLAAVFLFTVHFFNCHFRPEKFPIDIVMFTGCMPLAEFKHERRVEYDRLVANGELDKYLVGAPQPKINQYSKILGFTLIAVGLVELLLVLLGFMQGLLL